MIGYSRRIQRLNTAASTKLFGVRFGRYCIKNDISVIELTQQLGTSRQTVYNWFLGISQPRKETVERIRELYPV